MSLMLNFSDSILEYNILVTKSLVVKYRLVRCLERQMS